MNRGADPLRGGRFDPRIVARRRASIRFRWCCRCAVTFGVIALLVLLLHVLATGLPALSPDFFVNFPSRRPESAGIRSAIAGSAWMLALVAAMSFPVGLGTALYLEEYAPRNRLTNLLQTNIETLAGVPSIVYGLLGLGLFVRLLALERSLLAGAATLSLLVLPLVIIAAREAIRAIPGSLREAAYALGASRWQTIRHHVLPAAGPRILSGMILGLSRAGGETAPLLVIGALTWVAFDPVSSSDPLTALPVQVFNWTSDPREEFHALAAGAIVVLVGVLLLMNAAAIVIRNRYER